MEKPQGPTRKSGFREIAERAGVSIATVDRVINDRGGVSPARAQAVVDAARALSIGRLLPEAWRRTVRVELILPRNKSGNPTPFWRELVHQAQRVGQGLPDFVLLHRTMVEENNLAALRNALLHPAMRRDAVIIAAEAGEQIAPELDRIMASGEVVVTIVSDVKTAAPHVYCGVDNRAQGRTAGLLMRKGMPGGGRILVLRATDRRRDHEERTAGFIETFGDLLPVDIALTHEDLHETRTITARALATQEVAGIYLTGHTPEAVAPLLRDARRRPLWITHELSPAHARLLRQGLLDFVLDQDPRRQIEHALRAVVDACTTGADFLPHADAPEFRIYTAENIPPHMQAMI